MSKRDLNNKVKVNIEDPVITLKEQRHIQNPFKHLGTSFL